MTTVNEVRCATARLFSGTWRPLASVFTTVYHAAIVFRHRAWYRALSLRVFAVIKVRASSSSPSLSLCQILFLSQPPWTNIAYSVNHSRSLFDAPGTQALALRNYTLQSENQRHQFVYVVVELHYMIVHPYISQNDVDSPGDKFAAVETISLTRGRHVDTRSGCCIC